ncbi:hypothetical protein OH77DRAFT_1429231 [Trametes cingulata]|nr:hypothetical protein OH77DRAFT_1429231 [Trametes cingulata]
MQLSAFLSVLAVFAATGAATPTLRDASVGRASASIISEVEMAHWLATTDAELIFVGQRPNPLSARSAQITTVTYCDRQVGTICGGTCTVYTGGATCLSTPGTACISATRNVDFCSSTDCSGTCNALALCRSPMGSGFCSTPDTQSIIVRSTFF